jgi:lactoylglutathione lyase
MVIRSYITQHQRNSLAFWGTHDENGNALMKLAHINLTTTNPVATAEFLCTYFGLRTEGGNNGFMLLFDDNDMVITLMKAKTVDYPQTFHVGFYLETEMEIDAMHERLLSDGHSVTPPKHHHGYSIYVEPPGGSPSRLQHRALPNRIRTPLIRFGSETRQMFRT